MSRTLTKKVLKELRVVFELADGTRQNCVANVGDTLMDVALDNGVPGIIAQCGGGCTCCTCHLWVADAWLALLNTPHQDELDMLAYAWGYNHRSRLACQVALNDALDGIRVTVPEQQA